VAYGRLNQKQRKTLTKFVRGKVVHDLGAGDLELSSELLRLGASEVYAIDKEPKPRVLPSRVHYKQDYFHNIRSPLSTIFLAWPTNHDVNLVPIVKQAEMVIYLGCNTGGTACGHTKLFKTFVQRELLAYEPDKKNSLVVLGKFVGLRQPTGEELAGLNMSTSCYYTFEEAERLGL